MGERVKASEYPGAQEWVWMVEDGESTECLDVIADDTLDDTVVMRMRPAELRDIDIADLADTAWEAIRDHLWELETLTHDNGGPDLGPYADVRVTLRREFEAALRVAINSAVDLSEAAWQPTGERVRVYPDGTVERIDDGAP